jgi:hypothetical protein
MRFSHTLEKPSSLGSGRAMARTGLRNDADVSIVPPKIPYGGFSPVRLQGWLISRRLPASGVHVSRPLGLHPAFVPTAASVSLLLSPLSVGARCAHRHRHASGCAALTRGALAPVRVILSRPIHTYATPSAPLAGTVRFHCSAAYTPWLRCALPPRRPATGSVLSLLILSQHVALCDSGEFDGCLHPVPSPTTLAFVPSAQTRLSPTSRKSVSRGGHISVLHYGSLALQPADLFTLLTD